MISSKTLGDTQR